MPDPAEYGSAGDSLYESDRECIGKDSFESYWDSCPQKEEAIDEGGNESIFHTSVFLIPGIKQWLHPSSFINGTTVVYFNQKEALPIDGWPGSSKMPPRGQIGRLFS